MKVIILFFTLFIGVISAELLPVETFFKDPDIKSARLSPTGKYFAASVEKEGKFRVAVIDLKQMKTISVISLKDGQHTNSINWISEERFFITVDLKVGSLATPVPTGWVYAANADGSLKTYFGWRNGRVLNSLKDEPDKVLIQKYNAAGFSDIFKVNTLAVGKKGISQHSKARKQIQVKMQSIPGQWSTVVLDKSGYARFAVGNMYSEKADEIVSNVYFKKDKNSEWEILESFQEHESGMFPIAFNEDDSKVLISEERGQQPGVYLYDPINKSKKIIWENKSNVDLDGYIWDGPYGKKVPVGVRLNDGKPSVHFFDGQSKLAQLYHKLSNAFPSEMVRIYNSTWDNKTALILAYSEKNPGDLYKLDINKLSVDFLLSVASWIKPEKLVEMKPISYQARDGLKIHGYLTLPKGKTKNLPMVLKVHGGPFGVRDYWGFDPEDQFLANRGYAVLKVNYRGSGGYGKKFEFGAYRKVGAEMQDDLTDATLWAIEQGIADKNRICIYGGSYGGYASLMGVVKEPDLYKCAIPYVGVYDIERLHNTGDIPRTERGRKFLNKAWGDNDKFFKERSPIHHLNKLKAALFIIHGEEDDRAHFSHYEALAEKLDDMKYPYESLVKEKEGHGFRLEANKYELYTKIEKFLKKHIGN